MRTGLFECDGADAPPRWRDEAWDLRDTLQLRGSDATVKMQIEETFLSLSQIDGWPADLLRIAAYVFAADQSLARGGHGDGDPSDWRRRLALAIPVRDPQFWSQEHVRRALTAALAFVTDDAWEFHFREERHSEPQAVHSLSGGEVPDRPDSVVLLSGGADSLCALVELIGNGHRPVLVHHRLTPRASGPQKGCVDELRRRYPAWTFPEIDAWIQRRGPAAREHTKRSRPFLFASVAAACAAALQVQEIVLAANGIASLHFPLHGPVDGPEAIRSTHPTFIRRLNALFALVLDPPVRVRNPLWNRTRAESLDILVKTGHQDLLGWAISCPRMSSWSHGQRLCGSCPQCVDRRFGEVLAEVQADDAADRYAVDILGDALPEGEARTVSAGLIGFARAVDRLEEADLLATYPPLYDCIADQADIAGELVGLLQRHSKTVLAVVTMQVHDRAWEIAAGTLPPSSMIGLSPACPVAEPPAEARPVYAPDYSSAAWAGDVFHFTPLQAAAVRLLHEAQRAGVPELRGATILEEIESRSRSLSDLFKNAPAWGRLVRKGSKRGSYRLAA